MTNFLIISIFQFLLILILDLRKYYIKSRVYYTKSDTKYILLKNEFSKFLYATMMLQCEDMNIFGFYYIIPALISKYKTNLYSFGRYISANIYDMPIYQAQLFLECKQAELVVYSGRQVGFNTLGVVLLIQSQYIPNKHYERFNIVCTII